MCNNNVRKWMQSLTNKITMLARFFQVFEVTFFDEESVEFPRDIEYAFLES